MNPCDDPATPQHIAEVSRLMDITKTEMADVLAEIFFTWDAEDVMALLPDRHVARALQFLESIEYASTHRTPLDEVLDRLKSGFRGETTT